MKFLPQLILLLITAASMVLGYCTKQPLTVLVRTEPSVEQLANRHVTERSPHDRLGEILRQPAGSISDEELQNISEALAPTDPESAAQALLLCKTRPHWTEILGRLSQENPVALIRLLREAKELRFRNDLEAYLLKAQFAADPEGLFQKALTVQNGTRSKLLLWAVEALSKTSPSLAIAQAQSLAPGIAKVTIMNRALRAAMEEDPQGTLRWIAGNHEELNSFQLGWAVVEYQKAHPDLVQKLISSAPEAMQRELTGAVMVGMHGPTESKLDFLRSLPPNLRDAALRTIPADTLRTDILPKLTPEERPAAIEMTTWWTSKEDQAAWLDTLETQEDKAAAARMIPYLPFIDEEPKAAWLRRLAR
jgi:hypothetical protein